MNEEKENSFWKKVIISIKDFEKYPQLASKNWGIVLSYLVKLLAIFTIIVSFTSVYEMSKQIENGLKYVREDLPDFTFSDNKLKLEQTDPIIYESSENLFQVIVFDTTEKTEQITVQNNDETTQENSEIQQNSEQTTQESNDETNNNEITKSKEDTYKEKLERSENGIIFLEDKMLIKAQKAGQIIEYPYTTLSQNMGVQSLNKQELLNYFSGRNLILLYVGIFIITWIYLFILYFISIWLDIILLASFGFFTALFMRLRLRYSAMCKIAIHSLT